MDLPSEFNKKRNYYGFQFNSNALYAMWKDVTDIFLRRYHYFQTYTGVFL